MDSKSDRVVVPLSHLDDDDFVLSQRDDDAFATLTDINLGVASYPSCCGVRRQRSAGGPMLDLFGFGDVESVLTLTHGGKQRELSVHAADAESGKAATGDEPHLPYDSAVVEHLRLEFQGALAMARSECADLVRREATRREEYRGVFEAALLEVGAALREDVACLGRELRAGDAALGERIGDLSARSDSQRHDILDDRARVEALASQIHEKCLLFDGDRQALEKQVAAFQTRLEGETVACKQLEATLRAEIGQLASRLSQEDCASQALLRDAAVTKALAEQRQYLDTFATKQQNIMDERLIEYESSSVSRANYAEALMEQWGGEQDKARAAQASSMRSSWDDFTQQLRHDVERSQSELQKTVAKDVQSAIALHRQDISKSIEDLRVMLIVADQHRELPACGLPSVPESRVESVKEPVAHELACPIQVAACHGNSPGETSRESSLPLPMSPPVSPAPPLLQRSWAGNASSMPSLLKRATASPSAPQTMPLGSLSGSMRSPAGAGSSWGVVSPRSPRVSAAPAASAALVAGGQSTPRPTRRSSPPPPQVQGAPALARRGASRALSPAAPSLSLPHS